MKPKAAVINGSRAWNDALALAEIRNRLIQLDPSEWLIVTGGASGIDTLAHEMAKALGFETKVFYAQWNRYGQAAGVKRNCEMIDYINIEFEDRLLLSFWDGVSNGTRHAIDYAIKCKLPVEVRQKNGQNVTLAVHNLD